MNKSKDIKAKFKNGILNIEIPKVEPKKEEATKIDHSIVAESKAFLYCLENFLVKLN